MKEDLLTKQTFDIRDLAKIVKKQTQTIRSWEAKGIIKKPEKKSSNGWREYNKDDLANTLEKILTYNWERKVIKNETEIQFIVDYLRGKVDKSAELTLLNNREE